MKNQNFVSIFRQAKILFFITTFIIAIGKYSGAQEYKYEVNYSSEVKLVPQRTGASCWAASAAMVIGWKEKMSVDPAEVANGLGYWKEYYQGGYPVNDFKIFEIFPILTFESLQSYTVEKFYQMLYWYGPIWTATWMPANHARVIVAMWGDGSPDGTFIRIFDPLERGLTPAEVGPNNRGSFYDIPFSQFYEEMENMARVLFSDKKYNDGKLFFIAHCTEQLIK